MAAYEDNQTENFGAINTAEDYTTPEEDVEEFEKLGNVDMEISDLKKHAKNIAESVANAKTGIPFATIGRNYLKKRAEEKALNESLQTGAGIFIKDIKK